MQMIDEVQMRWPSATAQVKLMCVCVCVCLSECQRLAISEWEVSEGLSPLLSFNHYATCHSSESCAASDVCAGAVKKAVPLSLKGLANCVTLPHFEHTAILHFHCCPMLTLLSLPLEPPLRLDLLIISPHCYTRNS